MTNPSDNSPIQHVVFSEHFLERFIQRTRKRYKRHMELCIRSACAKCAELELQSNAELEEQHEEVVKDATRRFWMARELRGMEVSTLAGRRTAHSRYFRQANLIYVVSMSHPIPVVVTCYPAIRASMVKKAKGLGSGNRKTR